MFGEEVNVVLGRRLGRRRKPRGEEDRGRRYTSMNEHTTLGHRAATMIAHAQRAEAHASGRATSV